MTTWSVCCRRRSRLFKRRPAARRIAGDFLAAMYLSAPGARFGGGRFDELFEPLQVALHSKVRDAKCVSDVLDDTFRFVLHDQLHASAVRSLRLKFDFAAMP